MAGQLLYTGLYTSFFPKGQGQLSNFCVAIIFI